MKQKNWSVANHLLKNKNKKKHTISYIHIIIYWDAMHREPDESGSSSVGAACLNLI